MKREKQKTSGTSTGASGRDIPAPPESATRAKDDAGVRDTMAMVPFTFEGDALDVVRLPDGDIGVGLRRLSEAVTVDADAQMARLTRAARRGARWATTFKTEVVAEDGKVREMVVLPRRSIPMWAATISLAHVREDLRDGITAKLAGYHDRCAEVLADHFLGKRSTTDDRTRAIVREELAALGSPPFDGAALGAGAARLYILDPLLGFARMQARALGREDQESIALIRLDMEGDLRHALRFPYATVKSDWASFPLARLGDAQEEVARLHHRIVCHLGISAVVTAGRQQQLPLPSP